MRLLSHATMAAVVLALVFSQALFRPDPRCPTQRSILEAHETARHHAPDQIGSKDSHAPAPRREAASESMARCCPEPLALASAPMGPPSRPDGGAEDVQAPIARDRAAYFIPVPVASLLAHEWPPGSSSPKHALHCVFLI
jgi:hypothetical protein